MEQFIETVKQFPLLWNTQLKDYHSLNKKDVAWRKIVEELKNPDIPDEKTAKNEWKKLRDSHRESIRRMKSGSTGQAASPKVNNWIYAELLEFLLPYMKNRKRTGNVSVTETEPESRPGTSFTENLTSTENDETSQIETSTENLTADIHEGIIEISQKDDSTGTLAEKETQRNRKAPDDSSLRDLLKEVDNDFMQRCEQRDKRKLEIEDMAKKNKHPLDLFFDSMCESTKKLPDWLQIDVKPKLFKIICEAEETYDTYMSRQPYGYNTSEYSTPLSHNENSYDM